MGEQCTVAHELQCGSVYSKIVKENEQAGKKMSNRVSERKNK